MSYLIAWSHAALWVFYQLPLHSATLVDRAMIRFAERGEGEIVWEAPYHHLRAGRFILVLSVDRAERRITVVNVYRVR